MNKNTYVITIAGIKGGIGKTTLTDNIAVAFAKMGKAVLIIDANIVQFSSAAFINNRPDTETQIDCKMAKKADIYEDLLKNEESYSKYDYIIIDSGGTTDSYTRSAILAASYGLLIVPTQPSILDIWAMEDTFKMLQEARKIVEIRAYALINMVMPYKTKLTTDTQETLNEFKEKYGIEVLNQTIGNRVDFKNAITAGKGVLEYAPKNKAAKEIQGLVNEIIEKLK